MVKPARTWTSPRVARDASKDALEPTVDDADDGGEDRPTAVPDYDVGALAASASWEAQLPKQPRQELPLDLAVPVRKRASSVDGAPLRAAFLLSHVDDRMSVMEIAVSAQIPLADAIEAFVLLADLGLVDLQGSATPKAHDVETRLNAGPMTPKSGLRPKT